MRPRSSRYFASHKVSKRFFNPHFSRKITPGLAFILNPLSNYASYSKKYGTLCCIVLQFVYIFVLSRNKKPKPGQCHLKNLILPEKKKARYEYRKHTKPDEKGN